MQFLPPIQLPSFPVVFGGFAVNHDGSLVACADYEKHCVFTYDMDEAGNRSNQAIIGTWGSPGFSETMFHRPRQLAFVFREGTETLLILDVCNRRIVEVTTAGVFIRSLHLRVCGTFVIQMEYSAASDKIAVLMNRIVVFDYKTFDEVAEIRAVLDDSPAFTFTADGNHILVANRPLHCIAKYNIRTGSFVCDVVTREEHGLLNTYGLLEVEDGSLLVYQGSWESGVSFLHVMGSKVLNTIKVQERDYFVNPRFVNPMYSKRLGGVIIKESYGTGRMKLLKEAWPDSDKCAWIFACACE